MDNLPKELFGSWVVASIQTYTNNRELVAPPSIDYWNIYRSGNVLTLENPQTGAKASVTLDAVKQNTVSFTRKKKTPTEEVTETPTITISGENFAGKDKMLVKKYKNNVLVKTDVVEFFISGRKVGGDAVSELLNQSEERKRYE